MPGVRRIVRLLKGKNLLYVCQNLSLGVLVHLISSHLRLGTHR